MDAAHRIGKHVMVHGVSVYLMTRTRRQTQRNALIGILLLPQVETTRISAYPVLPQEWAGLKERGLCAWRVGRNVQTTWTDVAQD